MVTSHLHARIRSAQAAYEGAIAAHRHSPNADNARALELRLVARDYRLEQLWAELSDEERAAVDARPIKALISA